MENARGEKEAASLPCHNVWRCWSWVRLRLRPCWFLLSTPCCQTETEQRAAEHWVKWWWLIMLCERIRVRQGQYIDRAGAADELGGAVAGLLAVWTFCPRKCD